MFDVFHGNDEDGYHIVEGNLTEDEAWRFVHDWRRIKKPNLHADGHGYYRLHITAEGYTHIDYGSHTEFFQFRPI